MQPSPAEEWQRLTRLYAEMSDGELEELASQIASLTEIAQPILRDELKKRGLDDPGALAPSKKDDYRPAFGRRAAGQNREFDPAATDSENPGEEQPVEYTWKTLLCECADGNQAWQVSEVLRRAGIESWIDGPRGDFDVTSPRVIVAADQLDEARAILAQPIPQDIVDQSHEKPEDFVPLVCPKCGAPDPTLESVDPIDSWLCEDCGARWSGNPASGPATSDSAP